MVSSVLIIKLLIVTSHFGRILSIWCFNDISFSNISLDVSVIALFAPTWIITFCNSSCNKLRFYLTSSIFPPGMGWTCRCLVFDSLLSSMSFNMESPTNSSLFCVQLSAFFFLERLFDLFLWLYFAKMIFVMVFFIFLPNDYKLSV